MTHRTHYHWPAGRYNLAGDCDSPDTLSLARWEILPGWWLRLTRHTITGPLGDITWLVTATQWTHYHWTHYHWTHYHWTHYHWPTGRHYLAGDCESLHTLSSARWETLPGWWLWLTGHTITGPLGDITWLVTATHRTHYHWPAGRYYLAGDCDSPDTLSLARWETLPDWWLRLSGHTITGHTITGHTITGHTITGPLVDITWLVTATHWTCALSLARWEILPGWWLWLTGHTITGPLGDITWLVTATHWTHYHWPAGRYYLAGDCDSLDTLSLARWEILPGWWLWLTGHTITGPLGDITWLVTATHWTHYHWPAGRYYLAGDCDSLDTLSLARWEILPGWWLRLTGHTITGPLGDITWLVTATHWTHYHWPAGRYYLAGDCDSLDTLSLARW